LAGDGVPYRNERWSGDQRAVVKEQIMQSGERGIELANVGVIAGWILSVLWGLFMIVWCSVVGIAVLGGFNAAN
jgi:hypothetical protein